jgi:predicted enzyme related to lactoylglutathione lyase
MKQPLHGLRTVIYPTSDLLTTKNWWRSFLGQEPYFDQPFYVGFNVGGYELGLLPDADISDGAQVYWGVDNVLDAVGEAVQNGATVLSPATDVGEGIVTATVRIPDGSVVGFIYNPNFKNT